MKDTAYYALNIQIQVVVQPEFEYYGPRFSVSVQYMKHLKKCDIRNMKENLLYDKIPTG